MKLVHDAPRPLQKTRPELDKMLRIFRKRRDEAQAAMEAASSFFEAMEIRACLDLLGHSLVVLEWASGDIQDYPTSVEGLNQRMMEPE